MKSFPKQSQKIDQIRSQNCRNCKKRGNDVITVENDIEIAKGLCQNYQKWHKNIEKWSQNDQNRCQKYRKKLPKPKVRTTENDVDTERQNKKKSKWLNTSIEKLVKTIEMISKLSKTIPKFRKRIKTKDNCFKVH